MKIFRDGDCLFGGGGFRNWSHALLLIMSGVVVWGFLEHEIIGPNVGGEVNEKIGGGRTSS